VWHRSTAAGVAEFVVESAAPPTEIPLIVRRWSSAADAVRPQVRNQPPLARFLPSSVEEFNPLESVDAQRSLTSSGCTLNRAKYGACRFSDRELLKAVQHLFGKRVKRLSFDRGFHSPDNQKELSKLVTDLCLPKPRARQSVKQLADADAEFLDAQQNHSGVEPAIGALQSGNGMQRCRDRAEIEFERYVSLAILGCNLLTLGRLLIAQQDSRSEAALTRRKAA